MDSAIPNFQPTAIVVMGVSGCGKSSVGEACAAALGWTLLEGDTYHPPENVAKMRGGIALTDADRAGWLQQLATLLRQHQTGAGVVLTCSALRRKYRDSLRQGHAQLGFVFLALDYDDALARVRGRPGHFFSPTLVADQFATLESPLGEPGVLVLDARLPLDRLVAAVLDWLAPPSTGGTRLETIKPITGDTA